jgi:signal transduction histidine kinase
MRLPREVPHYPLSSETRHNLFLSFEEALNNVLKHSGATKVKVEMVVSAGEFELKIADDGKGFDVPGVSGGNGSVRGSGGGNGLKNMRQRLAGVGGDCAITSQSGKGTVIEMHIPLNTEKTA